MPLVRLLGATDSMILSELMDRCPDDGSEFYATGESIGNQFGFTAKRVQVGIARLVSEGLINQEMKGLPRRSYYTLNFTAIESKIAEQVEKKTDCKQSKKRTTGRAKNGLQEGRKMDCINNKPNIDKPYIDKSKNIESVEAENSASGIPDFDQLINDPLPSQKEKNNAPGGRLHQQMVEVWNQHLKAKYSTSVAELSKLGIGKEMAALKKIREYLHTHHVNAGVLNPDEATLADFRYILENKHKAGHFYDRSELTHTARYLLDIIKGIKNQPKDKYGKIDINEALEGAKQFMRKLNGQSDTE